MHSEPPAPGPGHRLVGHLRAVLVLLVIAVTLCAGLPGPGSRKALADEAGQQELGAWVDLLGQVGVHTDADSLAGWVMRVSKGARSARAAVVGPFRPGAADFEPLYDSREPTLRWRGSLLAFRRVRAHCSPSRRPPATCGHFVDWMAREAFGEDPTRVQIRVALARQRTMLPGEPVGRITVRRRFTKIRTRREAR